MKLYLASGLENGLRVKMIGDWLRMLGHEITYDWTTHGSVQAEGQDRIREVAAAELDGVMRADAVIVLLPGGRGTHVELGAALASGKPVYVADPQQVAALERVCAFYLHPLATFDDEQQWLDRLEPWLEAVRASNEKRSGAPP